MRIIPSFYCNESEYYIEVPTIQRFFSQVGRKVTRYVRQEMFDEIEEFANESEENAETVKTWVDHVLREGTIELHLYKVTFDAADRVLLNDERWMPTLQTKLSGQSGHFVDQGRSETFQVIDCYEENGQQGRIISFSLYRTVHVLPKSQAPYTLTYPTFVDILVDQEIMVVRGKSKNAMFAYTEDTNSYEECDPIKTDNLLTASITAVRHFTGLALHEDREVSSFKRNLYDLLQKYTETPPEIIGLMEGANDQIIALANNIRNQICHLPDNYRQDILWDVNNLVEKYFSISYEDKTVFTKNRDAYPLHLVAKDDEESKVEQTSGFEEPLQARAIFFDNKKMMQKSECCEGLLLKYFRRDKRFFGKKETIKVTLVAKPKYFVIKFMEYAVEEDIQHVLFSLLGIE